MKDKAKRCELCLHWNWLGLDSKSEWKDQSKKGCAKGHYARFYKPKLEDVLDPSNKKFAVWGWKRRCSDFEKR